MKKFNEFVNEDKIEEKRLDPEHFLINQEAFYNDLILPSRIKKNGVYDGEGKLVFNFDISKSQIEGINYDIFVDYLITMLYKMG